MQIVYLDQNVFSVLAELSAESPIRRLLAKLITTKKIVIPYTDSHVRETLGTSDMLRRETIFRIQSAITQDWHFGFSPEKKPLITKQEMPMGISEEYRRTATKETLSQFKALNRQTRENLAESGFKAKDVNNSSAAELIAGIEKLLQSQPSQDTGVNSDAIKAGISASAAFTNDLLGESAAKQFEAQVYENLAKPPAASPPKDIWETAQLISNAYTSTGLGYLSQPAGMFLLLSSIGYWRDDKPLEIEDVWHFQFGWESHHFVSRDHRFLKRFEAVKAIYETDLPKLHELDKFASWF